MPDPSLPLLELTALTRRFPGVLAVDDVSLVLARGEVHALVGENGAGKSTLINIISGLLQPDAGSIQLEGQEIKLSDAVDARRQGIVTVHQEAELFPTLSVAENMALEQGLPTGFAGLVRWRHVYRNALEAVALLGEPIDVRQPAARLSVAERHMTGIAAAVTQRARVLILDEPTSALTTKEVEWLFEQIARLKDSGVGILYISHRQEEIFALADRVTVLRDGRRVWSGPRAAIDRKMLVRQMVGREQSTHIRSARTTNESSMRLEVEGYSDNQERFHEISFCARAGEVIGIYGLVGSGRSEFAQSLFGLSPPASGSVRIDGRAVRIASPGAAVAAGLAYLPEDRLRQAVFRGLSVRANLVVSALGQLKRHSFVSAQRERELTGEQIAKLDIRCRGTEQSLSELSGGNQQKVVLARWLLTRPKVLILDEPTRGVDVGAKAEIHRLLDELARTGTAIVMISSDLPEIMDNSDRIVVFREGRVAREFLTAEAAAEAVAAAALPTEQSARQTKPARRAANPLFRNTEAALALVLVALVVILAMTNDAFFAARNLEGLLANASVWIVLSLAAASVILAGAIDISIGALFALASGVGGLVLKLPYAATITIPLALLAALAVGAGGGLLNATLTLAGRLHPIVVTLGTMTVYRGLLISLTGGDTITDLPSGFVRWSSMRLAGLQLASLLAAIVALCVHVWFTHLRGGRYIMAVGSSASAARQAGISKGKAWLTAFGLGGLLTALAAMIELSQTGAMQSSTGAGYELQAIAAAVIGGVAISGGRGSVLGVCLGALLLSVIYNAVVVWQISRYHYSLVTGGLLLGAILLDLGWRKVRR